LEKCRFGFKKMVIKRLTYILVSLLVFHFNDIILGQSVDRRFDSLVKLTTNNKDTIKLNALVKLCWNYRDIDPLKSFNFGIEGLTLAKKLLRNNDISTLYNYLGLLLRNTNSYDLALYNFQQALQIADSSDIKTEIAYTYNNIGDIYNRQQKYTQAENNLFKALEIFTKLDDKRGKAYSYHQIALAMHSQKHYDEAIRYNKLALELREKINDKEKVISSLRNLGISYTEKGNLSEARNCFNKTELLQQKVFSSYNIANTNILIGKTYQKENDLSSAISYYKKAYKFAGTLKSYTEMRDAAKLIGEVYKNTGKFEDAYIYLEVFKALDDSVKKKNLNADINQLYLKNEFEVKYKNMELIQEQKDTKNQLELSRQRYFTIFLLVAFFAVITLAFFIYREYNHKKKSNKTLLEKNHEITEKNEELNQQKEEITVQRDELERQKSVVERQRDQIVLQNNKIKDGIIYASRIQKAILPSDETIREILPNHMLYFKPKDVVSGDFYYIKKLRNYILIALADCTGHGVPGAFMSMLGYAIINEIVNRREITNSSFALNELRSQIKASLRQTGKEGENKDGMDIAFCSVNTDTNILDFAGANCDLIIFRNNEMIRCKGDRMPIGIYLNEDESFRSNVIQLQSGDNLYVFTDGYSDQIGGPSGRKFLTNNFIKLLAEIHKKPMEDQKNELDKTLEKWRSANPGYLYDQIDDITVIGIKI
jgi:serine phosphatase RsbU (regulator of sigma subunit)